MLPLILIAAASAILWLLCAFRLARIADDSSDEIARQLSYGEHAHCPPLCTCRGATAAMDAPFPQRDALCALKACCDEVRAD